MERDQLHKEDSQWKKARCQGDSFQGENRELGNFRGFMDLFCVCFLSLLYLLNYNKFGGLQQHGFILFCFWGSDVPFHWAPVEMLARLVLSGGAEGGDLFLRLWPLRLFSKSVIPGSASIVTLPSSPITTLPASLLPGAL